MAPSKRLDRIRTSYSMGGTKRGTFLLSLTLEEYEVVKDALSNMIVDKFDDEVEIEGNFDDVRAVLELTP